MNGLPQGIDAKNGEEELQFVGTVSKLPGGKQSTGPLGPLEFFRAFGDSRSFAVGKGNLHEDDGTATSVYYPKPTTGKEVLRPGNHPSFQGIQKQALCG